MRNALFAFGLFGLGLLVPGAGCGGGGSDYEAIEVALGAATSVAHASSIAVGAMAGPTACATVARACGSGATYPCDGEVAIALGDACPLPLGGAATGSVSVTGSWSAATDSTMTTGWTSVMAGGGSVYVRQSTGVRVRDSGGTLRLTAVGQDISVAGAAALAAQSTLTVDVDQAGTPGDPSDDVYTVDVTQQNVTGGGTKQLTISNARIDPSCRLSPVAGQATLQEVSGFSVRQEVLRFHAACDGKADVTGTFGTSGTVALRFVAAR